VGDTSGTTTVRETERKYESDGPLDAGLVAELATAIAGAPDRDAPTPQEPMEFALSAAYYDTADLRLARSGLTLRRRRGGSDDGWHLKLPAGTDSRDEVRFPLGRARKPPAQLVALTRAAHRGAPLGPVVELDTVRREWTLTDAEGNAVATVTDDRVTGRTLGAETGATSWAEIEVELAGQSTPCRPTCGSRRT
jgi:inorganic triphosphatase YgiF